MKVLRLQMPGNRCIGLLHNELKFADDMRQGKQLRFRRTARHRGSKCHGGGVQGRFSLLKNF